jgi:dGTPase
MNKERIERWERLLSSERLGESNSYTPPEGRSRFDQDYDRIVFSSAFRRLQDKTQVFPLSQSDYTRTRLTHSVEVSCVGRSLGQLAGKFLQKEGVLEQTSISYGDVGTIVAAACLAHDTGNPPFGHSGESSIQQWADMSFKSPASQEFRLAELITGGAEQQDFLNFEGNAQSFRIYSKLQGRERRGGLRLTLATIGALTKYPRASIIDESLKGSDVAYKKFGYFQDDRDLALEVFRGLGLLEQVPPVGLYWPRRIIQQPDFPIRIDRTSIPVNRFPRVLPNINRFGFVRWRREGIRNYHPVSPRKPARDRELHPHTTRLDTFQPLPRLWPR